jgi:hypothetical protein
MATRIQLRRGDASEWTSVDPVLSEGELGYETDTGKFKIGNGSSLWSALDYFLDSSSLSEYLTQASASTTYQAKVTNVDDTEIGYLNNASANIQTQLNSKAPVTSPVISDLSLNALTDTSTPLIINTAQPPPLTLTNAVVTSGTVLTYTFASPPPLVVGDRVRIRVELFPSSGNKTNPFNFENVAVATVDGNTITVNIASGGFSTGTFISGDVQKIISANTIVVRDSAGSTISTMDSLGNWSTDAYFQNSTLNNQGSVFANSGQSATIQMRYNNIPSGLGYLFYGNVGVTFNQSTTLTFTLNGANVTTYNYGSITKTNGATVLTQSGVTSGSGIVFLESGNYNVFYGTVTNGAYEVTVIGNTTTTKYTGNFSGTGANGIALNTFYQNNTGTATFINAGQILNVKTIRN